MRHQGSKKWFKCLSFLPLFIYLLILSCATARVSFATKEPGKVNLVSWDSLESKGEDLGSTPLTVETSKLAGKVAVVSGENKLSQYWVLRCDSSTVLDAKIQLSNAPICKDGSQPTTKQNQNLSSRLLLKSYQALAKDDYNLAKELAQKLEAVAPELAAPHIIIGLAALQTDDRTAAKAAFAKASALDPEDQELQELLRNAQ
jgi:hypothetical protein